MEFMGISVGILALICTAMLLFGVRGTRKILGWTLGLILVGAVGVGAVFWAWPALQRVADGNRGVILAVLQGDRLVGVYSTESEARRAMAKGDVLVEIERNFVSLSPEQQNATIQKIAASER